MRKEFIKSCFRQRGAGLLPWRGAAVLFFALFLAAATGCEADRALTLSRAAETQDGGAAGKNVEGSGAGNGAAGMNVEGAGGGNGAAGKNVEGAGGGNGAAGGGAEEGDSGGVQTMIWVHVCGAVRSPGLMEIAAGSRAGDALEMAGGFADDADTDYVNLAAFLEDGQKLYFPTVEESRTMAPEEKGETKVDLNRAGEEELCSLPGIGSSRAKAILKYRNEHGKFQSIEEVLKVPGIKEGLYEQIKDLITAG